MFFGESSAAYESITSRMRALAVVRPLLALDESSAKRERGWEGYRLAELALAAIDFVTLRIGARTAVRQEAVVEHVAESAALQVPGRAGTEYREVARWLVERMINTERHDRCFRHEIGSVTSDGFVVREFPFQILKDVPDEAGQAALTVTDAAITVLVHAVDVDIASEQIAAEAKLAALLKRARIGEAWQAARTAHVQSIRYAKELLDRMEEMKRNVRAIDWEADLEGPLKEAQEHVEERSQAETQLKAQVAQLLAVTEEEDKRQRLEALDALIEDCLQRHLMLIDMLLRVVPEFRRQQDRQIFVPPVIHARVHLRSQLLEPALELSIDDSERPLEAFVRGVLGPVRPRVMYLPDYFEALTRMPEQAEVELVAVGAPEDCEDTFDPPKFDDAQHAWVDRLLSAVPGEGVRLSRLLERARQWGEGRGPGDDTDHLLAMETAHRFRHVPVAELARGEEAVVVVDDGTELDDTVFGGSDFLLLPATGEPVSDNVDATPDIQPPHSSEFAPLTTSDDLEPSA
ncbi:hypothetical protein ACWCXC_13170 [Streptomyces sp. NPDC001515]